MYMAWIDASFPHATASLWILPNDVIAKSQCITVCSPTVASFVALYHVVTLLDKEIEQVADVVCREAAGYRHLQAVVAHLQMDTKFGR